MLDRRRFLEAAAISAVLPRVAAAQAPPSADLRLNEPGPENGALAARTGLWDLTETAWDGPDAAPVTTTGLVAERRMVGSALQETLRPASDTAGRDIRRVDYLRFNRVEGRWDYVSIENRVAVGLMPAWSFTRGEPGRIELFFAPFAIAGPGEAVSGRMLRMRQVITFDGPDRDAKDQYMVLADGGGTVWQARRYAYARRS